MERRERKAAGQRVKTHWEAKKLQNEAGRLEGKRIKTMETDFFINVINNTFEVHLGVHVDRSRAETDFDPEKL